MSEEKIRAQSVKMQVKEPLVEKVDGEELPTEENKLSLYEQFVQANKKQWNIFNIMTTLVSIGMAVGTFFIIAGHPGVDCKGIKTTLYLVFIMHCVNSLETILNIFGWEKKLCTGFGVSMFLIFETTVIIYMQVIYFNSMPVDTESDADNCMLVTPYMYFWMMANILLFYIGSVVVICYFFRGFCQDPQLEEEERIKDQKSRDLYEQRKLERQLALENGSAPLAITFDPSINGATMGERQTVKGNVSASGKKTV